MLRSCKDLKSRRDLVEWLSGMLPDPFLYNGSTGAAYDEGIREFEYCSRPLWAIFSLIAGGDYEEEMAAPFIKRIKAGLKPGTPLTFPDPSTARRQTAVEMAVYGYGLLCCKEKLLNYLDQEERSRLAAWLNRVNEIEFPRGNWYFFLLIINYGLKENGFSYSRENIDFACREIESLYIGGGWYKDGHDCQRDYYIPFAFHFYSLLLDRYCPDHKLSCVRERSLKFEPDFLYWLDSQGRSLPFGRSLTYRFAHVCYWCACAVSGVHGISAGEVKDMIFRNFNYWAGQDILSEGMLSIGYGYPNLVLSEDYNAPGSPMWAFKAFVILSLPQEHDFWKEERKPVVLKESIREERGPGFLIVAGEKHHYALSACQYSSASIFQHMSKYGKFCYSTAFGFNCSRDVQGISGFAADSTLSLSVKGTGQFAGRGRIEEWDSFGDYIYSRWVYGEIAVIESWLVPVNEQFHIRIHRIHSSLELETYEGAFPVFGWSPKFCSPVMEKEGIVLHHGSMSSGIWDICRSRRPEVVLQGPNTNIYNCERNGIPALKGEIVPSEEGQTAACLVYGDPEVDKEETGPGQKPVVSLKGNCLIVNGKKIILEKTDARED